MVRAAKDGPDDETFIVATEVGILTRMQQIAPSKNFVPADPEALCAFMKTITLDAVKDSLEKDQHIITVPPDVAKRATAALDRMVSIG